MSVKIINGNLLDLAEAGDYKYILHGCNCFHAMGSGIAGEIARRYPVASKADQKTVYGDPSKLGSWSETVVTQVSTATYGATWKDMPVYNWVGLKKPFGILNGYTQYTPGKDFLPSLFPYLISNLNKEFSGVTIGLPAIGCGIAGDMGNLGLHIIPALLKEGPDVDWEICLL